jgi:hypothetical protein
MRISLRAALPFLLLLACGTQRSEVALDASSPSDAMLPLDATGAPPDAAAPPSDAKAPPSDATLPPTDAGADAPPPADASADAPPPADASADAPPPADAADDAPSPDAAAPDASFGTAADSGAPCGAFEDACAPAAGNAPSFCGSVPASWHTFASITDALPYVERTWLLCSGAGIFGIANQAGLSLGADGTYHVLVETPSGELVTSTDPNAVGTYTAEQTGFVGSGGPPGGASPPGAPTELSFTGKTFDTITIGVFTDSPPMMVMMTFMTDDLFAYVPQSTAGWTAVANPQPSLGTTFTPPAVCGALDDGGADGGGAAGVPDAAVITDDGGANLFGDWISCGASPPMYVRSDFAGIRIDASGTFEILVWDGAGQIEPATDIFDSGWWSFQGILAGPGPLYVQIEFQQLFDSWGGYPDPTRLPNWLTLQGGTEGPGSAFVRRGLTGL